MLMSFNNGWRGKPSKKIIKGKNVLVYNGNVINPAFGWMNMDLPLDEIYEALTSAGYPICAALTSNHKCDKNFLSCQLVLVDIDDGMRIDDLNNDPLYQKHGCGYYTSPSHKEEHHKFRIMFQLETPIVSAEKMRMLYKALIPLYGADEACKDATRMFFGTEGAVRRELKENVFLTDMMVDTLVEEVRQEQEHVYQEYVQRASTTDYQPPSDKQKREVLEKLKQVYLGNWNEWFKVAVAMKNSGYDEMDFVMITGYLMRQKTEAMARKMWGDAQKYTECGFGYLINLIKRELGNEVFKPKKRSLTADDLLAAYKSKKQQQNREK